MFSNYFAVAFRNLKRDKWYTAINILGLGIGIAAIIWAYQTYRFSFSFNNFHPDQKRIFRCLTIKEGSDGLKGVFPLPAAEAAMRDFAGIDAVVRLDSRGVDIKGNQRDAFSQGVHFTDPAFFDFFNFPVVKGSNDLSDKSAVLITEETAEKYFGTDNPIGQTLLFYAGENRTLPLTVKGVLKNPPVNSSIHFKILTNFENLKVNDSTFVKGDDWKWFLDAAFFRLPNPADAGRLSEEMKKYTAVQNAARQDFKISGFYMEPLSEIANHDEEISANGLQERPEDSAAYGPFVLALLIFLSACLNFANTTVSRSNKRLREMGVRKVMGGTRSQLVRQLLLECSFIVLTACLFSMVLNAWWIPRFNAMFDGLYVHLDYLNDGVLLSFIGFAFILATLMAGAYPAFYLSGFNAALIFKGSIKLGGSNLFSRILLGLQIVVSLITVIAGIAFSQNAAFQRDYDYGYDRQNVIGAWVTDPKGFDAFRNAVSALPGVESLTGTRHHIGFGYRNVVAQVKEEKNETAYLEIGDRYLETMKLSMTAGRKFDKDNQADYDRSVIVSQKFAGMFGWKGEEALGQQIRIDTSIFTVVGILQNFHADNLFNPMEPIVMRPAKPERYQSLIVRAKPGALTSTYEEVKTAWATIFPLKPFNGFYQDEVTAEAMQTTTSIASIFSSFSVVAILLAITGLFALVSLTVLKKMKEIAVRKVVGAKPLQIMGLINKDYVWVFAVSIVIGCSTGWFLTRLLMDMIFKINVGVNVDTLVLSVVVLLALAALTVGIKVRQAIRTNPADILRSE